MTTTTSKKEIMAPSADAMSTDTKTLEALIDTIRRECQLLTAADSAELLTDFSLTRRGGKSRPVMALDKSDSAKAHGKACRAVYIHVSAVADVCDLVEKLLLEVPKAVYAACSVRKLGKPVERALKKLGFEVKTGATGKLIIKSTDKTDKLIAELTQGLSFVCQPYAEQEAEKLRLKELEALKGKDSKEPEPTPEPEPEPEPTPEDGEQSPISKPKTKVSDVYHILAVAIASGKVTMQDVTTGIQAALDAIIAAEQAAKEELDNEMAA